MKDESGHEMPGTLTAMLADPAKAPLLSHLRTPDGRWIGRNDVWVYDVNEFGTHKGILDLGFGWDLGNKDWFGPELQFGHAIKKYLPNKILIIKTAWGGKSLYSDFRPPSSGGTVGPYYRTMVETVRRVLANLGQEFPALANQKAELAGFVWWHGWNDFCDPKHAVPEYEANLANLIRDLRHDLASPKLPVVIGEFTGPWGADCKEKAAVEVRRAQANVAQMPEFRKTVRFVETHNFVRAEKESPTREGYHEFKNGETYFLIGNALGEGMAAQLKLKRLPVNKPHGIRDYGLKSYLRLSKDLPHVENKSWKLIAKLPYNCQFQPSLVATGPAGQAIQFNSSNPLVQYLTPTEQVTTTGGSQVYEAKNWVSGEGAIYTIPAGVTVTSVKYRETGFDTSLVGSFECNDEDFNILWRRATRTAYLCMRDHFYDCPDRERVGFWGDGTPELDQCFYLFDSASHELCRDLVLRKLEPKFYPGQHLEFLGEYGLWFYYLQTGDLAAMQTVYPATKEFLLKTYHFGNKNTWFDWGKDVKDTSVIENCFEYIDLKSLRKMALITGHEQDLPEIDAKLTEIKNEFNKRFWRGSYYQSLDVSTPDDRANAMAINADLAEPEKWDSINRSVLSKTTYSSCFFDRWVFEALCKIGRQDQAMIRMANRYRTMIDSRFSTLWEHYDRWWASWIDAFDDGSSLNHGWNPPAILLPKEIAGIRPIEAGWKTFEVLPKEAFLTYIKVEVPTVMGPVHVRVEKTSDVYGVQLESPRGTAGIVGIPKASFVDLQFIAVNGTVIWRGAAKGAVHGVSFLGDEEGYLKFRVAPGKWSFRAIGHLDLPLKKLPRPLQEPEVALDKRNWTATASAPDGIFTVTDAKIAIDNLAINALDDDVWTGWRDMSQTQHPGQWFQVDMKHRQSFDKIVLDNTWALWDSPNAYEVAVSDDGIHWSSPIASGKGHFGITTISFSRQTARFIRVTQTGSDSKYHWSIFEFDVYRHQS